MLDLFTTKASGSPMALQTERELIFAYQINGYDDAVNQLLWQYRGLLQKALYDVVRAVSRMTDEQMEDLSQDLLVTALEVISVFDPERNDRLSQVLPQALKQRSVEMATALEVPRGTLALWFKIWRLANKDYTTAANLAPSQGMTVETFRAIMGALEFAESEWVTMPFSADQPVPDTVTYTLAHIALDALTPAELLVIEHAYGFRGDPKSDGDVALITNQARSTVSTLRTRAIDRMRNVLMPATVGD